MALTCDNVRKMTKWPHVPILKPNFLIGVLGDTDTIRQICRVTENVATQNHHPFRRFLRSPENNPATADTHTGLRTTGGHGGHWQVYAQVKGYIACPFLLYDLEGVYREKGFLTCGFTTDAAVPICVPFSQKRVPKRGRVPLPRLQTLTRPLVLPTGLTATVLRTRRCSRTDLD